jgi:hypothetical protein
MNKLSLTFILSIFVYVASAQGINFQGVARSANGTILASSNISLRLSIISKNVDATPEYIETKTVVTNAQGIFSIVVGDATNAVVTGNFKNIAWKDGIKFLKVEMDPSAGTNYINMGATQLQYVPYSFYSLGVDAANVTGILPIEKGGTGVGSLVDLKTALKITTIDTSSLSTRIDELSKTKDSIFKDAVINGVNAGIGGGKSNTNTLFGYGSLQNNTTGQNNTATGSGALLNNTTGNSNTAIGQASLTANTTGTNNTAVGQRTLYKNTTGKENTAIGSNTMTLNDTASYNTAVGSRSMRLNIKGIQNTAIGVTSLELNTEGSYNNAIGEQALNRNTSGIENIAFGNSALQQNTIGRYNLSLGNQSMLNNTIGGENVAIGHWSLWSNIDNNRNVGVGAFTLRNSKSNNNTAIGYNAMSNNISYSNSTALGYNAQVTASNQIQLGDANVTDVKTSGAITADGIISSKKSIRPPSITLNQRNLITDTLSGMVIWCNNCGISGQMQVYNGVEWTDFTGQVATGILKTYIPDNNFEQALITLGYDDILDDSVLTNNISRVKILNIGWKSIQSLQGIQDFKYLEELDVRTNKLSTLDVTRNIYLKKLLIDNTLIPAENYNTISSLDLSNNPALQELSIMDNKFTSIDVTRNANLLKLYIGNNHSTSNNTISSIDLSKNTKLTLFNAGMIPMSTINLSSNPLIIDLGLTSMPITSVDLSGLTSLVSLNLGGTQITNLNLSSLTSLQTLFLLFNTTSYLTSLVVPVNLQSLSIRSTALTSVDLTRCPGLKTLSLESTSLTSGTISLTTLTNLESMSFRNQTNFGNINFANHTNLKLLSLFSLNSISSINTSYLVGLNNLFLDNIPISVLDISGLTSLKSFRATNISTLSCIKANQSQINSRTANNLNWPIDNGTSFALICN